MKNNAHDLSDHLDPGETILWEGAPTRQLFVFRPIDAILIPAILLWTYPTLTAVLADPTFLFLIIPALFIGIGVYILIGRFFWDAWRRRGTHYALTDKRALIHHTRPFQQLREQPLQPSLTLSVRGKGRGALTFGPKPSFGSFWWGMSIWTGLDGTFTFRAIDDPQAVYEMARAAIQGE